MVYNFSFNSILNAVLPVSCGLCDADTRSHLPLCQPCLDELPVYYSSCPCCALPTANAGICGSCQQRPPACDRIDSLFLYQEPLRLLVQQFKFNRKLEYGRLFAELMAEKITSLCAPRTTPDLIIPVPLHRSRLRQRGYNQSWEIARQVSRLTGISSSHRTCSRIKKTPLQTALKASERRKNLRQAFSVHMPLQGLHVCIIDDVMTTGSTLEAIASALKKAGAKTVSGMVVARAVL